MERVLFLEKLTAGYITLSNLKVSKDIGRLSFKSCTHINVERNQYQPLVKYQYQGSFTIAQHVIKLKGRGTET
jgi:hypothetical protein